ncbi:MAG: hypothetical protein ABSD97_07855 [Acidimicrobiales bacterium]
MTRLARTGRRSPGSTRRGGLSGDPGSSAEVSSASSIPDEVGETFDPERREDLFVRAFSVQGGEADIGGEQTAFARIVLRGVQLDQAGHARQLQRQDALVLKLDEAAKLATELRDLVNTLVRATPTPVIPAFGTWSWTRLPPSAEDLVVARASAQGTAVAVATGVRFTVRVDLTGTLVGELSSSKPSLQRQGAVFSGAPQIQALVSSLKKVVNTALERRRTELYLSGFEPLAAFGF